MISARKGCLAHLLCLFCEAQHRLTGTCCGSQERLLGGAVQDIFDMGLLPADTDFRMFSYGHHGAWPGLDIAFLLDAAAYHTDRDTTSRIRAGTLQVAPVNWALHIIPFSADTTLPPLLLVPRPLPLRGVCLRMRLQSHGCSHRVPLSM